MSDKLTKAKAKKALKIDDAPVKAGRILRVYNKARAKFSNAKKLYYAVWVEDANGNNERCLLFTAKELERAEYRASRNQEDLTDKDFLTDFFD